MNKVVLSLLTVAFITALVPAISPQCAWAKSSSAPKKEKRKAKARKTKVSSAKPLAAKAKAASAPASRSRAGIAARRVPASTEKPIAAPPANVPLVEFDRIDGQKLFFKAPASGGKSLPPLQVNLWEMKYLGVVTPNQNKLPGALPYFVVTGKACPSCDQDLGVYLIRPDQTRLNGFVFPGKLIDFKTRNLVMESRAFFGRCLPGYANDVFVKFQKEKVDRRSKLQASVFIAEPEAEKLSERLLEKRLPSINNTLRLVKSKACQEIDGRNRLTLPKPMDVNLRYRSSDLLTDEEQDDTTKENETDRDLSPESGDTDKATLVR